MKFRYLTTAVVAVMFVLAIPIMDNGAPTSSKRTSIGFGGAYGSDNTYSDGAVSITRKKSESKRSRSRLKPDFTPIPEIEELRKNPSGTIAFNPEPIMAFNEWHSFQVIVSRESISPEVINRVVSSLRRRSFVQYTSLQNVTKQMVVEVVADKPDEFQITPDKPVTLDVIKDSSQEYSVKPLKLGRRNLYLKLKAVIRDSDSHREETISFPEFTRKIEVKISAGGTSKASLDFLMTYWVVFSPLLLLVFKKSRNMLIGIYRRIMRN